MNDPLFEGDDEANTTLTEEERTVNLLAPANIRLQEEIYYRKPQLR